MADLATRHGIETHGQTVVQLIRGLGAKGVLATRWLVEQGVTMHFHEGVPQVAEWYPVHQVLAVIERIGEQLGDEALARAGESVLASSPLPRGLDGIRVALRSLDIAYHMSHRKNGAAMFDEKTGRIENGIGHYVCADAVRHSTLTSSSLYPCAFDRGVVSAVARKFEPSAEVNHLGGARCRRRGSPTCTYVVTW